MSYSVIFTWISPIAKALSTFIMTITNRKMNTTNISLLSTSLAFIFIELPTSAAKGMFSTSPTDQIKVLTNAPNRFLAKLSCVSVIATKLKFVYCSLNASVRMLNQIFNLGSRKQMQPEMGGILP